MTIATLPRTRPGFRIAPRKRGVLMIDQKLSEAASERGLQEAKILAGAGYKISILCPADDADGMQPIDGITPYHYPTFFTPGSFANRLSAILLIFLFACRIYITRGFNVIHACNASSALFLIGGFFHFMFGVKFIVDHHRLRPDLYEATTKGRDATYFFLCAWEKLMFLAADICIAPNQSYREIALNRGKMPPERIFVIRSNYQPPPIQPPALLQGKKLIIACAATMEPHAGIDYLIEAARHITQNMHRANVDFIVLGGGSLLDHFKAVVAEKKLDSCITFTGAVDARTMHANIAAADICMRPEEVNPVSNKLTAPILLDYMALGKPIVQFAGTEARFSCGDAALYAHANDARDLAARLITLIDDPQKRAALGVMGRMRIERDLSWGLEAPKLLAAYDAVFACPVRE